MFLQSMKWAFAWAVVILILCGIPGSNFPKLTFLEWLRPDKIVHLILFGTQAFLLIKGFLRQTKYSSLQLRSKSLGVTIAILYGILVEVLQSTIFIGRTGDYRDAIANAIGAFVGLLIFNRIENKKNSLLD